ncbi:DUF6252 family protein [uncultured Winogradskyella sp.]|uniref:DUF6252 family protein n=1 Tax=uncultured Winogradskyella sp. TaxID=395353 RepID=UPI002603BD34|nr:DUF6252 family protein [uncultured Winogradskyella sp.]
MKILNLNTLFKMAYLVLFVAVFACDNEPYEGPFFTETPLTCVEVNGNLSLAQINFDNANANDYETLCEAYKNALEDFIAVCPEVDSETQALLDNLGDCELYSFFQVDFNGQTFFADDTEAVIEEDKITITGFRGLNGEQITLSVFAYETGTYTLGVTDNNQTNIGSYNEDNTNLNVWQSLTASNASQGEVTITDINLFDATISGVFNFSGYNDTGERKEFTSGIFENIKLEKVNAFFAKVDGIEFVDTQIVPGINNFGWVGFLARDANNEEIFLSIRYNVGPGTYALNQDTSLTTFDYSPSFQDFHYGEGSVIIEIHNTETNFLMGTFSCTALPELSGVGTYEITEGRFCVTYLDGFFEED